MIDDKMAADIDSVLEYEYLAAGSVGLLRHNILQLTTWISGDLETKW